MAAASPSSAFGGNQSIMDVLILATLFSVLFAIFFLVFFVRTRQGQAGASLEQDSLLPFANEDKPPKTVPAATKESDHLDQS